DFHLEAVEAVDVVVSEVAVADVVETVEVSVVGAAAEEEVEAALASAEVAAADVVVEVEAVEEEEAAVAVEAVLKVVKQSSSNLIDTRGSSSRGNDGNKIEYRVWNPFRSKLAAAILGGVDQIHMPPGTQPEAVFASEVKKLQADKLKPQEQITLEPYERDHAVVVGVFRPPPKVQ
ncbi:rRNA 2'-O-methyltransferase fibrillarin, partial [Asbolus verrucosus]